MPFPRLAFALLLISLLAACGGGPTDAPLPLTTAAATVGVPPATSSGAAPAPDCAAEGCASLRIIDGNAEAWRIDAERRAALESRLGPL